MPSCKRSYVHILYTSISSAPSSGADPTKTSILIRISIFEFTRHLTAERCKCFLIGGVKSMPVNIVFRVHYNFTNYLFDVHRVLITVFFSIFFCWFLMFIFCAGWREVFCPVFVLPRISWLKAWACKPVADTFRARRQLQSGARSSWGSVGFHHANEDDQSVWMRLNAFEYVWMRSHVFANEDDQSVWVRLRVGAQWDFIMQTKMINPFECVWMRLNAFKHVCKWGRSIRSDKLGVGTRFLFFAIWYSCRYSKSIRKFCM